MIQVSVVASLVVRVTSVINSSFFLLLFFVLVRINVGLIRPKHTTG